MNALARQSASLLLGLACIAALPARLRADEPAAPAPPASPASPPPASPPPAATSPAPSTPAVQLPDDAGRSALETTCLGCHPADRIVAQHRTEAQWQEIMTKMMEQGAMASEEDLQSIYDYLVRHFGEPAAR